MGATPPLLSTPPLEARDREMKKITIDPPPWGVATSGGWPPGRNTHKGNGSEFSEFPKIGNFREFPKSPKIHPKAKRNFGKSHFLEISKKSKYKTEGVEAGRRGVEAGLHPYYRPPLWRPGS